MVVSSCPISPALPTSDTAPWLQVKPFQAHKIEPPSNVVETSLGELAGMYELMYKMRRMEIAADMMYKVRLQRAAWLVAGRAIRC